MNIKQMQFIIFLLGGALALGGCAKEVAGEAPTPEGEEPTPALEEIVEPPPVEEVVEEVAIPEEEPAEPLVVPREERRDIERRPPRVEPDAGSYLYMVRHNNYLYQIATDEYGDPSKWRNIYDWNRELIGDDPDLIYPYNELELRKPENEITRWEYDYTIHVVEEGETLWSIAGMEYNDEIAWIVIFWDNEETLASNKNRLKAGMELRIRTELWPGR